MLVLNQCTAKDAALFARRLLSENRAQAHSFEKAARTIVNAINTEFRLADGSPQFALLRIFRFSKQEELHSELLPLATAKSKYWLALMGTVGTQPAWCERRASQGHRAIPADNAATPMLRAVFEQIGLRFGAETGGALQSFQQDSVIQARYFHVPTALGSPFVPVQDEFVAAHKIASVIGIGSILEGDSAYICIGFSLAPIEHQEAAIFAEMNPFIGTLLAFHGAKSIWE